MAFGEKAKTGFGNKEKSSGFGNKEKSSGSFGSKSESKGFGNKEKSSGSFGSKSESKGFGNKEKSGGFGNKEKSSGGFGNKSEEKSTGFKKKTGFGGKSSSGFNKAKGVEFKSFAPLGSTNKAKEIKAKLGDIDQDMKGIMVKLIGDHRDKRSSEDVLEHFAGLDASKVKLDVFYDETVAMCPSFAIFSKNGSFSGGDNGFKSSGLFLNGKKATLEKYSMTSIGLKFKSVIEVFLDITKILDDEEGPLKVDMNNSTISIIDGGTVVITPSSMLLNSLKNDMFKVSQS